MSYRDLAQNLDTWNDFEDAGQPADGLLRDPVGFISFKERKCRVCGCTQMDCRGCIERKGKPCYWVEYDLCSACLQTGVEITS